MTEVLVTSISLWYRLY